MGVLRTGNVTPKQEAFAQKYIEIGNAADAYLFAYDCSETIKRATVTRKASELLENPRVIKRVAEIKEQLAKKLMYTKEQILKELMGIVGDYKEFKDLAVKMDASDEDVKDHVKILTSLAKSSDAISALKQISKMLNFDAAEKVDVDHKITINITKPE